MWQGLNLATNAFLRWSLGPEYSARLLAVMEMPKVETHLSLDFSSLLGPIFYCWLSQLLLPLFLVTLVYEKQCRSAQPALSVNLCEAVIPRVSMYVVHMSRVPTGCEIFPDEGKRCSHAVMVSPHTVCFARLLHV